MAVDSGASATVIGEHQVKAVTAKNPRHNIEYEVADGTHIENMWTSRSVQVLMLERHLSWQHK